MKTPPLPSSARGLTTALALFLTLTFSPALPSRAQDAPDANGEESPATEQGAPPEELQPVAPGQQGPETAESVEEAKQEKQPLPFQTLEGSKPAQAQPAGNVGEVDPQIFASPGEFVRAIESGHNWDAWPENSLLRAKIIPEFGGNLNTVGTWYFAPDFFKARAEFENGVTIGFDGEQAWRTPADAPEQNARFWLPTMGYFLGAQFKLGDPGANLELLGQVLFGEELLPAAKITFGEGVGDAPDDWYIAFRDPQSNLLAGLAYIVTYSKSVEKAEENVKAVVYDDFTAVNGVVLPATWTFYKWSPEKGLHGDIVYSVALTDMAFVPSDTVSFSPPEESAEEPR